MIKNLLSQKEMLLMRLEGEPYQSIADKAGISRQRIQQILSPPPAIRRSVVAKAKGKCEHCGIKVGSSGHVHHIGNEGENYQDIENLQLLCPSCHRKVHCQDSYLGESSAKGVRLSSEDIQKIISRATRRGWSFNKWINWAVSVGLRSHKKKEG